MLAMAECASSSLGRVVCRLPRRIVEKRTQSREMIGIQVLLLPTERHQCGRSSVVIPGLVPRLGVSRSTPLSVIVLPDGEPYFQEGAGYVEHRSHRTGQQLSKRVLFFSSQMPGWCKKSVR